MAENRTKTRRVNLLLQAAFAVIVFLGLNLAGNKELGPYRLDLTADKLFTLSPGTETIMAGLERPITLKYFFSESGASSFPELYRYGIRVEDFLEEIDVLGGDMVTLEKVDPEAYSEAKTEAEAYGLVNLGSGDDEPFFLGLVGFDDTNRLEVVSRFSEDRERFLEYDLAKVIYLLAQERRPKLGIISGLPLQFGVGGAMAFLQGQSQSYLLYSQLGQFFELENIEGDFSAIPSDVDVLLVLHPPDLSDRQFFAIDQFVLAGNPALVFVDPFAEVSPLTEQSNAAGFGAVVKQSSDLAPLLKAWGVDYSPDKVVIDRDQGQRVEVALEAGTRVEDYVHWLGIEGEFLNPNDPVTAFLSVLNFASAGALEKRPGAGINFEPLVQTSNNAALIDAGVVRGGSDPTGFAAQAEGAGQYPLSARLTGLAETAFPGGVGDLPAVASGDINVIVTADADLFEDRFWAALRRDAGGRNVLVPIADNAAFVVNAIDHLSGSEGLVSLRARGVSKRPLEKFQEMRSEATTIQKAKQEELRRRLAEAQTRLADLESGKASQDADQNREQALREFKNQVRTIENNLNDVQRNLRLNIKSLENKVIFLNMFIVPALLLLLALLRFGALRARRKKQ